MSTVPSAAPQAPRFSFFIDKPIAIGRSLGAGAWATASAAVAAGAASPLARALSGALTPRGGAAGRARAALAELGERREAAAAATAAAAAARRRGLGALGCGAALAAVVALAAAAALAPHSDVVSAGARATVVWAGWAAGTGSGGGGDAGGDGARLRQRHASAYNLSCAVFCSGPVLSAVASAAAFPDSKSFVDMPLKGSPASTLAAFAAAFPPGTPRGDAPPRHEVLAFVHEHFSEAGSDLLPAVPADFGAPPRALQTLPNETLAAFAVALHELWPSLTRRVADGVRSHPERHTLLWVPHLVVVPGGRFRESYLWDSYWSVVGLLSSGMHVTATGVAKNLLHLSAVFGFSPNGQRSYYGTGGGRSQPPVLSSLVRAVYDATRDVALLRTAYPTLVAERAWWAQEGAYGHSVRVAASRGGVAHVLSRYVTDVHSPRPESFREDAETAAAAGLAPDDPRYAVLMSEIAAACESGMDFSSRWLADGATLATSDTSSVLPVDLNVWLFLLDRDLADFATVLAAAGGGAGGGGGGAGAGGGDGAGAGSVGGGCIAEDAGAPRCAAAGGGGGGGRARASSTIVPSTVYCERYATRDVCLPRAVDIITELMGPGDDARRSSRASWAAEQEDAAAAAASPSPPGTTTAPPCACATALVAALEADATAFRAAAVARAAAIEALMWDEAAGSWRDLIVAAAVDAPAAPGGRDGSVEARFRARTDLLLHVDVAPRGGANASAGGRGARAAAYASDFSPLFAGLVGPGGAAVGAMPHAPPAIGAANATRAAAAARALARSGLVRAAGVAASTVRTREQWDASTVWAPQQHMLAVGLAGTREPAAAALGGLVARRWLRAALAGVVDAAPARDGRVVPAPERAPAAAAGGAAAGGAAATPDVHGGGPSDDAADASSSFSAVSVGVVVAPDDGVDAAVAAVDALLAPADVAASPPPSQMCFLTLPCTGLGLWEKYDADVVGKSGTGGEYVPQTGFAWSIGAALDLLVRFFGEGGLAGLEDADGADDALLRELCGGA